MSDSTALSSSLEDYLEVIFHIIAQKQVARVRDIASQVHVKNSSVTGALRSLSEKGLIHYAPYDVVTLTDKGKTAAQDVVRRHEVLKDFFVNVLAVDPVEADQAACKMEHCISPGILERFVEFSEYVALCPWNLMRWTPGQGYRCSHGNEKEICERCIASIQTQTRQFKNSAETKNMETMPLNKLTPGQKAKIVRIRAKGEIGKRILEMGVIPGSLIEVERVAPFGDPIQVKIKGYHLTLRKEEAAGIETELLVPARVCSL